MRSDHFSVVECAHTIPPFPLLILTHSNHCRHHNHPQLRALFYISMTAVEDIETQKRGVVGLIYNVGPQSMADRSAVWKNAQLSATLPLRWTGMHYCYDNPKMQMMLSLAMFVFGRNMRLRCRTHYGTQ